MRKVLKKYLRRSGNGQKRELRTGAFREQLPRNQIAVMLHLGEQYDVARFDVLVAPGGRHQVDALGGAAGENDFIRAARVDEFGRAPPCRLESLRGAIA